jgi:SAM-dependent methyltransferase
VTPAGGAGPDGEPASCAWCGAPLGPDSIRLAGRVRCRRCGAATTSPWPTTAELEAAYGEWYRPAGGSRFSFAGDAILRSTRGLLAGRIDAIAPPGPVLDVGAGDGTLLDALHRHGREAIGLERRSDRADVRDGTIADLDGEWAAVVFWHSLEHLPEPGEAIREAARLLKPGGVIAVAVPNGESLQAAAFGDRWLHLDLPRHLVHLSATSLGSGLERNGFAIERTSFSRGGQIVIGWLDGLVGKLPGRPSLYQALRRPPARMDAQPTGSRAFAIGAALLLMPIAWVAAAVEVALRRGGTVYVEGRRA